MSLLTMHSCVHVVCVRVCCVSLYISELNDITLDYKQIQLLAICV